MAKYKVDVVVTGTVTVEVDAENVPDATDAAFEAVDHFSFGRLSKIRTSIGCIEDDDHRDVTFKRPSCANRLKGYAPHYVTYSKEAF